MTTTERTTFTRTSDDNKQAESEDLGDAERKAIKAAFNEAVKQLQDIAKRAQAVIVSDVEPEMYSNLAEEACAITSGLRRLAWKGEALTREDNSGCCY